jgi:hypothetical protein
LDTRRSRRGWPYPEFSLLLEQFQPFSAHTVLTQVDLGPTDAGLVFGGAW